MYGYTGFCTAVSQNILRVLVSMSIAGEENTSSLSN